MRTGWAVVSASRPVTVKVRLWMSGRERPSSVRRRLTPSHRVPPDLRQSRCRSLHIRCACDDGRGQNDAGPEPRWPRPVDARDPLLTPRRPPPAHRRAKGESQQVLATAVGARVHPASLEDRRRIGLWPLAGEPRGEGELGARAKPIVAALEDHLKFLRETVLPRSNESWRIGRSMC